MLIYAISHHNVEDMHRYEALIMTKVLGGFSNDIHGLISLNTLLFNGT